MKKCNDIIHDYIFHVIKFGRKLIEYQNQAKLLFKKLNFQSPKQCTIESVPYYFQ